MRKRGFKQDNMQKWYDWLEEMKKERREVKMEEMHQQKVAQMMKGAEESAGLLRKISKPAASRKGAQIVVNEEDVRLLDRCEAKRKQWAKHWQCDKEVQNVEEKPWKNEELRRLEEELPWLKEYHLEDASRLYQAKTKVGCDGFHPKVPLDSKKKKK